MFHLKKEKIYIVIMPFSANFQSFFLKSMYV
jgi:hypothetical protein